MKSGENKSERLETSRFKELCGSDFPVFCLFICLFGLIQPRCGTQEADNLKTPTSVDQKNSPTKACSRTRGSTVIQETFNKNHPTPSKQHRKHCSLIRIHATKGHQRPRRAYSCTSTSL